MPSSQMMPSVLIRKARRRLMQPHLVVPVTSTGWCVLHITTHRSGMIISWLFVCHCILCLAPLHPTTMEDGHSASHLLQLWSSWSYRLRLYGKKVDFCSSSMEPLPPATSCSNKGWCYKNWSCKLHDYQGCSWGRASSHGHNFFEWTPNCHSIRFGCLSWLHQQGVHPKVIIGHWAYEHTLYDSHSWRKRYHPTSHKYSSQPSRKRLQDTSNCSRWSRNWCDIGNELDEGSQGIIEHHFSHHAVGLSRPWYCRSPAAITLKYLYLTPSYHCPEAIRYLCCMWVSRCVSWRLDRHASRSRCRVHHWNTTWHCTYLQVSIKDDT
jgi:hypothetical protein